MENLFSDIGTQAAQDSDHWERENGARWACFSPGLGRVSRVPAPLTGQPRIWQAFYWELLYSHYMAPSFPGFSPQYSPETSDT